MTNMGEPKMKLVAFPKDTNPYGNIFGGWIISQIDVAGSIAALELGLQRVASICMKEVVFKKPIFVGDIISCYTKIKSIGNTSINIIVDVMSERLDANNKVVKTHVTTAEIVYVSLNKNGEKIQIPKSIKENVAF